jgi:hypothetical protein
MIELEIKKKIKLGKPMFTLKYVSGAIPGKLLDQKHSSSGKKKKI